jgi:hypothetical protein
MSSVDYSLTLMTSFLMKFVKEIFLVQISIVILLQMSCKTEEINANAANKAVPLKGTTKRTTTKVTTKKLTTTIKKTTIRSTSFRLTTFRPTTFKPTTTVRQTTSRTTISPTTSALTQELLLCIDDKENIWNR